jgi:hypothetical protein
MASISVAIASAPDGLMVPVLLACTSSSRTRWSTLPTSSSEESAVSSQPRPSLALRDSWVARAISARCCSAAPVPPGSSDGVDS